MSHRVSLPRPTRTRRVLEVGQWLGTNNRIITMTWDTNNGWSAIDSLGMTCHQAKYPHGLRTWDVPTDGTTATDPTPWP